MPAPRSRVPAVAALLVLLLTGCAPSPAVVSKLLGSTGTDLEFTFRLRGGAEVIDQVLTIENGENHAVAPTLRLTALDRSGAVLPKVNVFTAYGSDRGRVVVPPGRAFDLLQFLGEGSDRVGDVAVTVTGARTVDFPSVSRDPKAEPVDETGGLIDSDELFPAVRVTNDNDQPVRVRVVYVVWEDEPTGKRFKLQYTFPIGDLITVEAHGTTVVEVEGVGLTGTLQYAGEQLANTYAFYSL